MKREWGRGMRRLRAAAQYYYPCFLLHFLLGLSASSVFLLVSAHAGAEIIGGGMERELRRGYYEPRGDDGRSFACVLFEDALYMPGERMPVFAAAGHETEGSGTEPIRPALPKNGMLLWGDDGIGRTESTVPDEADGHGGGGAASDDAALREALYTYDPAAARAGEVRVIPMDLSDSGRKNAENGGILFANQTGYALDGLSYLSKAYPIPTDVPEDDPIVLVIHTHGSEAFAPEGAAAVDKSFAARSEDCSENTVAVGEVFCGALEAAGIPVLHCTAMFDCPSYTEAYTKAAKYIRETVAEHPGIRYVFDIHRDALAASGGDVVRPVTVLDGEVLAQVMIVVGTDEAGADFPDWRDHLTAAVQLQDRLNRLSPTLARPINVRSAAFNAQYAPGSMLLEIGASGNSLEEAKAAAAVLGRAAAGMIRGE